MKNDLKSIGYQAKKGKGWSQERRDAQAKRCKAQKPSRHATGPNTDAGKEIVSQNAYKHGFYDADMTLIKTYLQAQARFIQMVLGAK